MSSPEQWRSFHWLFRAAKPFLPQFSLAIFVPEKNFANRAPKAWPWWPGLWLKSGDQGRQAPACFILARIPLSVFLASQKKNSKLHLQGNTNREEAIAFSKHKTWANTPVPLLLRVINWSLESDWEHQDVNQATCSSRNITASHS